MNWQEPGSLEEEGQFFTKLLFESQNITLNTALIVVAVAVYLLIYFVSVAAEIYFNATRKEQK